MRGRHSQHPPSRPQARDSLPLNLALTASSRLHAALQRRVRHLRPLPRLDHAPFSTKPTEHTPGANILRLRPIFSNSSTSIQKMPWQEPRSIGLEKSAFSNGEYRAAADRFLKTFTNFPNNERAPEALLKLAISLRRLGENAAACDSFAELQRRYPQGPKNVLQRADVEKKKGELHVKFAERGRVP